MYSSCPTHYCTLSVLRRATGLHRSPSPVACAVRAHAVHHTPSALGRLASLLHAGIGSDGLGGFAACDNFHSTVRRVDVTGTISTIAGNGVGVSGGTTGNGGPAMAARLNRPYAIFGDPATASIVILGKEGNLVDESLDSHVHLPMFCRLRQQCAPPHLPFEPHICERKCCWNWHRWLERYVLRASIALTACAPS